MQLFFARHGESFNNGLEGHSHYYERRKADPELTPRGLAQSERLAALIAGTGHPHDHQHRVSRNPWNYEGFAITHIYTSLQRRAVETASVIADRIDLDLIPWPDIHECGGVVEWDAEAQRLRGAKGATAPDLAAWAPRRSLAATVASAVEPEGWWEERDLESRDASAERADRVFNTLLERHGGTDDRVLLVSHSMFYVFFMCRVLGLQFVRELWFTLNNAGLTRVDIGDGDDYEPGIDAGWNKIPGLPVRIAYTNRLDHLPPHVLS